MNQQHIESRWKNYYKLAGIMALLIVLAGLVDAVTSRMMGEAVENSTVPVTEWFALFQADPFAALSALGIINVITLSLGVPLYLAIYRAQREAQPAFALLAAILFFLGAAIYLSSSTVFSMLALSRQYAAAADVERPLLEAAGRALLARGADLTPGTFPGFFFTQAAGIVMACVMLRGGVFSKWAAWTGLAGFALTSVFFVLTAFAPARFDLAMAFAMPGGLALMAYHIQIAIRFFKLSK